MMSIQTICIVCLLGYFTYGVQVDRNTELYELQKKLLTNYSKSLIPGELKERKNIIRIKYFLRSVNDFDEVTGHLQTTGVLGIVWRDERLMWDLKLDPVRSVTFSINDIWIPNVIIANPVKEFMLLHSKSNTELIRLKNNGVIQLFTGGVLATSCTPNVRYFPFDTHRCEVVFTLMELFHSLHALDLTFLEEDKAMDIVEENAKWRITQGGPYVSSFGDTSFVYVAFPLTLERKPMFFLITIIAPIVVLSLLNISVFFIPAQAGERISFAVSSLLSFAIYMTILSSEIPDNSDPVPLLSYLLMVKFGLSGVIAVLTVYVVRIFHRDSDRPIPQSYHRLVKVMHGCHKTKKLYQNRWTKENLSASPLMSRNGISTDAILTQETMFTGKDSSASGDMLLRDRYSTPEHNVYRGQSENHDNVSKDEITWQQVSISVDRLVFWIYSMLMVIEIILWISVTSYKYHFDHFK